jgi:formiminotetrahydrofolate cyclodeaminase
VAATGDLLDLRVRDLLDSVASEDPTPGGGSTAALAVAMAAGLTAMVARASDGWAEARAAVAQAERLRRRTAPLAQADAEVYEEALAAMRLPDQVEAEIRDPTIGAALSRAADVPLEIAEAAADTAELAALVAERGDEARRGDAVAAAVLAAAAGQAAATLVAVNLTVTPDDGRVSRARALVTAAEQASKRALELIE